VNKTDLVEFLVCKPVKWFQDNLPDERVQIKVNMFVNGESEKRKWVDSWFSSLNEKDPLFEKIKTLEISGKSENEMTKKTNGDSREDKNVSTDSKILPYILVCHASKDKEFCDIFVDFLESLGFPEEKMIYTSSDRFGVPPGTDIYDYLYQKLNEPVWVFFMESENFYKSPICMNEMGAVWIKGTKYYSFILPGLSHENRKAVINLNKASLDLRSLQQLLQLRNDIVDTWGLEIAEAKWLAKMDEFVKKIEKMYSS